MRHHLVASSSVFAGGMGVVSRHVGADDRHRSGWLATNGRSLYVLSLDRSLPWAGLDDSLARDAVGTGRNTAGTLAAGGFAPRFGRCGRDRLPAGLLLAARPDALYACGRIDSGQPAHSRQARLCTDKGWKAARGDRTFRVGGPSRSTDG